MKHLPILYHCLLGLVVLGGVPTITADDLAPDPSAFAAPAVAAVGRVNQVSVRNHWPVLPETLQVPVAVPKYDRLRRDEVIVFGRFTIPIGFTFSRTRQIVGFSRAETFKDAPLFDSLPKPGWSEARAVAVAAEAVAALLGELPTDLGQPSAKFYYPVRPSKKFYEGEWMITWPRVVSGHPFARDAVKVAFRETLGLMAFSDNRSSFFQGNVVPRLAREKALELSESYTRELRDWPFAKDWLQGFTDAEPSAELWMVNPNYIISQPSVEALAFADDPNARLAWVVKRKTTHTAPRERGTGVPVGGEVQVWVDAENGAFLGGDFR